ncbi:MAG TPA: mandelate racemase/muconate lactonizing enzyme family protein [Gemmataceae bacterium]|jgi:glucarate dehydratase
MKVAHLDFIPASIPYTHREVSSQVRRDGVTDVIVKAVTDDGLVGWGESCSGANTASVLEALKGMAPFVAGRNPWESEAIRTELWHRGIWQFRKPTASFAYAGIDMALWDICGKACGQPLYNLFGGKVRDGVNYFYYLAQASREELVQQCHEGVNRGFHVFYLKVGLDIEAELDMVRYVRETVGDRAKIRLDANGAWKVNEAVRNLARLDGYHVDFIEQPVAPDPVTNLQEVRARTPVAICANEGMWTAEEAYRQITQRTADVYCFSSYWVGSLSQFQRLGQVAHFEGLQVVKHTHGELGITAAAAHHLLLTLPNILDGNQQTAHMMQDDILTEPLPIASAPDWGIPRGTGLCIEVDEEKVGRYHQLYCERGQFLPYDATLLGKP